MYMKKKKKEKKNVHEANSMLRCGHTKTITVQLLCYVRELNACIVKNYAGSPILQLLGTN